MNVNVSCSSNIIATVLVFEHPQSRADANGKVILLEVIFPHNAKHRTPSMHICALSQNPEPSNWPALTFTWSAVVSSGSSWHNNPVSRLAVIASLALHRKQWPLSVSHWRRSISQDSHLCKRVKYVFVYTQAHSVESIHVVKAHELLLVEGRQQILHEQPNPSHLLQPQHAQTFN